MADKLSNNLVKNFTDGPPMVFKYLPFAKLDYALPYLLRRAIENKGMLQGDKTTIERMKLGYELKRRLLLN